MSNKTKTDPFPISSERMKWPFRTLEEEKKIIAWVKRQRTKRKCEGVELAPF